MINAVDKIYEAAKRFVFFAFKVVISAGLILWLVKQNRLDFACFREIHFDFGTMLLLLGGTVSVFCGLLLLGWRLWLLLRFKRYHVSYSICLSLTFMGSFLGVVLPGLVGGDALKAIYLCKNVSERRMDALASVFFDRVLGLYSMLVLGSLVLCAAWIFGFVPRDLPILIIMPTSVVLIGLGFFLIAWDPFFYWPIVQVLYLIMPKKIQNFVIAIREYMRSLKLIFICIFISLLNHALVVFGFIVSAVLIKDSMPIIAHFILNPLAMVMNAIPLTPGGLGMAESVFSLLFEAVGSPNGATIGLIGRFIQYAVFLITGSIALLLLKMRNIIYAVA